MKKTLISAAAGTIAAGAGIGYAYARYIEPAKLVTKSYTLSSERLPKAFHGLKIIQFSDLHLGYHYSIKKLRRLVHHIQAQQADVIVFTGDFADRPIKLKWKQEIVDCLTTLDAPFGKYWIYGNHDYRDESEEIVARYMKAGGFTPLHNTATLLKREQEHIVLAGIDDVIRSTPNLHAATESSSEDSFTILLAHEPDLAENVKHLPVDVQLSGHSHGGQVRIPFYGEVIVPPYGRRYVDSHYEVGHRPLHVFVSRGVGTTRMPIRFACPPEITILTLQRGQNHVEID
ncbi:metallophosphoesterase [Terribacillus saccharophilus]|uniref:metallophosphoesterase n=1 Tax=Terribacillus saccharophilus TaxID=361277 RepID=UPI003981D8BF